MLKKLRSLSESPKGLRLLLALKAFTLSLLLYLAAADWFWLLLFILAAIYFYFHDYWNAKYFLASFLVLVGSAFISVYHAADQSSFFLLIISISFGALFFLMLGVKNMIFLHRIMSYYFLNTFLFSAVFVIFFSANKSDLFAFKYLAAGLASFLLFREFAVFNFDSPAGSIQTPVRAKKNLIALVFAFLVLELLWVIALLPIGFLNSTSFLLLFLLLLEDLFLHNWNGTLSREVILRNTTFFLIISLIILGASRWAPQ